MAKGNRRGVAWLYAELPQLVSSGVLSEETAQALRTHYGELPQSFGQRLLMIILAVFGAALIGGGVILVLAHNWDDLSRTVRTVLSILPLLIAQGLTLYAFTKQSQSVAWRESTALFQALMVGAAISLVAQTYNISGDFQGFMRTWMLLALPLVYLTRSTLVALFYLGSFVIWSFSGLNHYQAERLWAWQYWPLYLAVLPHYAMEFRRDPLSWASAALGYVSFAALALTSFVVLEGALSLWILFYSGLLVALYALDGLALPEGGPIGARPLAIIGRLGAAIFLFILSFRSIWPDLIGRWRSFDGVTAGWWWKAGIPSGLVVILAIIGGVLIWTRRAKTDRVLMVFPLVTLTAYFLSVRESDYDVAAILMNAYGLIWGVSTIARGLKQARWGATNRGLILLSALILARFFDSEFSLIARGLAFVVLGVGCLTVNYFLWRKTQHPATTPLPEVR